MEDFDIDIHFFCGISKSYNSITNFVIVKRNNNTIKRRDKIIQRNFINEDNLFI